MTEEFGVSFLGRIPPSVSMQQTPVDVAQGLVLTRRPPRELETMAHPLADRAGAIVSDCVATTQ